MAIGDLFSFMKIGDGKARSRSQTRQALNLGIIGIEKKENQIVRDDDLEKYDKYYENEQYDHLPEWDSTKGDGTPLGVRQKQPRIKSAFAKTLSQRLTAKLVGPTVFPSFNIPDSPDDQAFLKAVIRESHLKYHILEPTRRMVNTGSVFYRFYLDAGVIKSEWYPAKHCYPEFQPNGELSKVVIKYVYEDENDVGANGEEKSKWYRIDLMMDREILYDNPEFEANKEPVFNVVSEVVHDLGFVQGEWFRTCEDNDSPDGYGLVSDIMDFIDELNYSLSQSSSAVSFNQDPQLTFSGMDSDELDGVLRSSMKSWNLGRAGKAEFLENDLKGVHTAMELRDKVRLNIQDISRILLLDPEKIVGSAQSAKAMEILHGPLKDLVDELRMPMEKGLKNLILKMALAILIANARGIPVPIEIPAGYKPMSLDVDIEWPPMFQQTIEDLQKKISATAAATSSNLISRETGTKYLAKDFGVENVEEEIAKIAAQPVLNPFGGF